ncbi:hypothetical protein L228DRAFT_236578 [Xylona heveae TC161]|uniref:Uncharacterized protein n=1 Tax=Xylona heveae (strain CBS 132557 / TC161) TaxID=1328760 RepID=A0A161TGZ9_XYLHT|nr:hypothetical protein L228DRAFT_236578 [Xylona heveae TC161]KZF25487.1 hypothetical protein L228DRAFT_236578 [Xylona heveae TC161]
MLPPSLPSGQQRVLSTATIRAVHHASAGSAFVLCSHKLDLLVHRRRLRNSPHPHHQQQCHHFWFDRRRLWSSYLGNDVQKHLERRHRALRHKYAKAMLRRSLWDRQSQLDGQNTHLSLWGWRAASSWGKHCGRWGQYKSSSDSQGNAEKGSDKHSRSESRHEQMRRRIEEVKKLVEEDPFGAIFGRHADPESGFPKSKSHSHWSPLQWLRRDTSDAHRNSQDIIDAVARRSDQASSTKVPNPPETSATEEYEFDPISMRKVPKRPNKGEDTNSTDVSYDIPVKKFRGYREQQIPQTQASAGETSSDFRSSHEGTPAAQDGDQLPKKDNVPEYRPREPTDTRPKFSPESRKTSDIAKETRDDVDLLRASDVRAAAGRTKQSQAESPEKKRATRRRLDAEFSKEQDLSQKAAEQAAMKDAAKRGRTPPGRDNSEEARKRAASGANVKSPRAEDRTKPAIDVWGYSLAPRGLETSYAEEVERRVQIGELEYMRELEARERAEPDGYDTEPMGLQTSFEEEQRQGYVDPRELEAVAREKEVDAYSKKPMGLETSYENEVREYPEGWPAEGANGNEAEIYRKDPMDLETSYEEELRALKAASDGKETKLDFDGYIGEPTELETTVEENFRAITNPSLKRKDIPRRDDGYSKEPMGLETSYMEELAGTARHESAQQKLRKEQQEMLEKELSVYDEGLEKSYQKEQEADESQSRNATSNGQPERVQSEGDLAGNVAEFASRDRWYKQAAPHSSMPEFEKYASTEIPDGHLDANLKELYQGISESYDAASHQRKQDDVGTRNAELDSALEQYEDKLGPQAYHFTTGQDSLEEELAFRTRLQQVSASPSKPTASSPNEPLYDSFEYPSRDPDPLALRLEEAEQRLHEEVRENNDFLYDLQNEISKSEDTLTSHFPSTLFSTDNMGIRPSRLNKLQHELEIHDLHLRLAEMQIERAGTILRGHPVATATSTSYTAAPQHLPQPSEQHPQSHERGLPTLYKVLAYDRSSKTVVLATTTSSTASAQAEPSLTPSAALAKLESPARFLAHFPALQAEGYEIVSGSGDVLVFKKVRETESEAATSQGIDDQFAGFSLTDYELVSTQPGGRTKSDIQYEVYPRQINPIDGTTTTPQTGNFASPTGFVNHDAFDPLEIDAREYELEMREEAMRKFAENATKRAEAINLAEVEPKEQTQQDNSAKSSAIDKESKTTGSASAEEEPFSKKLARGAIITTVAAGVTYAAGVVTELWRTGGF